MRESVFEESEEVVVVNHHFSQLELFRKFDVFFKQSIEENRERL